LPVRFTFDNNYFNDMYQGIPIGGYTTIIEKLLDGIEVKLRIDFLAEKKSLQSVAKKTVFTGMIDQFYEYRYGALEYRSLRFEHETLDQGNYQGNAVVNYTEKEIPFTRIIEHKHFEFGKQKKTIITREYPLTWNHRDEPYYPVNDKENTERYKCYADCARKEPNIFFGGRLADYQYYDMHHVVAHALKAVKEKLDE
jgi:UDP-galactopyranose mutase